MAGLRVKPVLAFLSFQFRLWFCEFFQSLGISSLVVVGLYLLTFSLLFCFHGMKLIAIFLLGEFGFQAGNS